MPILIRFDLDPGTSADLLEQRARRLANLRPVMKRFGRHMQLAIDDRFREERGPDGRPWTPLSAATLIGQYERRKGRKAFTKRGDRNTKGFLNFAGRKKILQDAGNRGGLRGSIAVDAGDDFVATGTNKVYGRVHQLGGEAGRTGARVTIPARPYLGFNDENVSHLRALLRQHLGG